MGETRSFKEGESTEGLLRGWCNTFKALGPEHMKDTLGRLEIWGQPRAWTDELAAVWTIELIAREHGRALASPTACRPSGHKQYCFEVGS